MGMVIWNLRYRSPVSPTRGVDTIQVSTKEDDEAKAREVAQHYLTTVVPHPQTRLVALTHAMGMTEERMDKEKAAKPEKEKKIDGPEAAGGRIGQ